jgi:octaprenyl-diphosphate synthase
MNPLEKYKRLYAPELALVDARIRSLSGGRAELIGQLIAHILNSGGKRLRPVFVILAAKLCGNKSDDHIGMAACVELLHTATLFHDDVVDESKLRRGRKTANELWGNSASVLVGDFLLAQSFMIMADIGSLEIIDLLSKTSSVITEGEVKQLMHKSDITTSLYDYTDIIRSKTAELFAACCRVGGVVSNVPDAQKQALEDFGRNLGIAFQIADDALDYSADVKKLGKKTGDDFREGKATLPVINAYLKAGTEDKKYLEEIFAGNEKARGHMQFKKAKEIIERTDSIEYTIGKSKEYADKAKSALNIFPENEYKSAMLEILDFCVNRDY